MILPVDAPWEKTSSTILTLPEKINITLHDNVTKADIGPMTLDLTKKGFGGVDLTPAKPWRMYYIFAIVDDQDQVQVVATMQGVAFDLVGSRIGFFSTDATGGVMCVSATLSGKIGDQRLTLLPETDFWKRVGPGWVLADGKNVEGSKYADQTSHLRVPNIPPDANGKKTYIKIA